MAGEGPPLVILGEEGSGKSSLLANWVFRHRKDKRGIPLIVHFAGASASSSDLSAMLRRILAELQSRFHLKAEIPLTPSELQRAFAQCLDMVAAKRRIILVIDGLDELNDRDNALELAWLPRNVPPNIRLVLSASSEKGLGKIKTRSWSKLTIVPMDVRERKAFIENFLKRYEKSLSPHLSESIVKNDQTGNPLYIKSLLDELRIFGSYEDLEENIRQYLRTGSLSDLFMRIFEKYEADKLYGGKDLVRRTLTHIWGARRGLSERELLEILGSNGSPLPYREWVPFYFAAERILINRMGYLTFAHDTVRQAVEKKYLTNQKERESVHRSLADFFETLGPTWRKFDELPWQLSKGADWKRLFQLLSDLPFSYTVGLDYPDKLIKYWAQLEKNSFSMLEAYRSVIDDPGQADEEKYVWSTANLLDAAGYWKEALHLREFIATQSRASDDPWKIQASLGALAHSLKNRGEIDKARSLLWEQESICREYTFPSALAHTLEQLATISNTQGNPEEALAFLNQAEILYRKENDEDALRELSANKATILMQLGSLKEAMALFKELERIFRLRKERLSLQPCLNNMAIILEEFQQPQEALRLLKESEEICRDFNLKDEVQSCLGEQAVLLKNIGKLEDAMALCRKQEKICRELPNLKALQKCLGNQGIIARQMNHLDKAMSLLKAQEDICVRYGYERSLEACFGNQGNVERDRGNLHEAIAFYRKQKTIAEKIKDPNAIATCLVNLAALLSDEFARPNEALPIAKRAQCLCKENNLLHLGEHVEDLLNYLKARLKDFD